MLADAHQQAAAEVTYANALAGDPTINPVCAQAPVALYWGAVPRSSPGLHENRIT
jgi:hypothetical protein